MKVKDIYKIVDKFAPFDLAEEWDNVGLLLGSMDNEVKGVLLTLDVTLDVIKEAKNKNANLIIAHHPFLFEPLRKIDTSTFVGKMIKDAMENGINIIAAHTNLDGTKDGLNDYLAKAYRMINLKPLQKSLKYPSVGVGRVGEVKGEIYLKDLIKHVKKVNNVNEVGVVGDLEQKVKKIAVCSGSGGGLFKEVKASGADCYITGELKHSMGLEAQSMGMALIDVSHYASEIFCIEILERVLTKALKPLRKRPQILRCINHKDPLQIR
ncbi:Nif3-like dinuclear metal center hexameric protein [bacterium]|nr:Nif3-like dinuclear metal center hexameric protein [bacterium]